MTRQEQFAYAAGLLDAEGCFHASRNEHCHTFRYDVIVNMDNPAPLQRMSGLFGGDVKQRRDGGYMWTPSRKALASMLRNVIPYLVVKREQAELLLKMRENFELCGRRKPTEQEEKERYALAKRISELKSDYSDKPHPQLSEKCFSAYVAGLIDGDGSIGVYQGLGNRFVPKMQIGMVDPSALKWIGMKYGIPVRVYTEGHKNPVTVLVVERAKASEICKSVIPYLRAKYHQAELLVRLVNHIALWNSKRGLGQAALPESVIKQRKAWADRCRVLNATRGRAETNSDCAA